MAHFLPSRPEDCQKSIKWRSSISPTVFSWKLSKREEVDLQEDSLIKSCKLALIAASLFLVLTKSQPEGLRILKNSRHHSPVHTDRRPFQCGCIGTAYKCSQSADFNWLDKSLYFGLRQVCRHKFLLFFWKSHPFIRVHSLNDLLHILRERRPRHDRIDCHFCSDC